MAKRYWGFNTLAGARRTSSAIVEQTTAGRFDATVVANSINLPNITDYVQLAAPFMDGSSAITGFISIRFDWWATSNLTSGGTVLTIFNAGVNAYRLTSTGNGTLQFQYWNTVASSWNNWGGTFAFSGATLYTFCIDLTLNSAFAISQGGVSAASSATPPTNGQSTITEVRHNSPVGNTCISQCMAADYSLVNSKYSNKLPNAEGTYSTDGTGAYTDINETVLDDSTAIQLPTSGQHRSFLKAALPTVPVGLQIAGMVVNGRGRIGGAITDGKLVCKQGATDVLSAGLAYGAAYEPRSAFFSTDPGTASAWTKAGFDTAEPGFQAV